MWSSGRARALMWGAALLGLFLGLLPFLEVLEHYPHGADAHKWVSVAHPDHPDWFKWSLQRRHFIGYRPVAALSFVFNGWVGPAEPWVYRCTDLLLHALTGLGLFALYRRWSEDRGPLGLLCLAVYLIHPAIEVVLPHLARRSYLLASTFSVTSLLLWLQALRADNAAQWRWALVAACALLMAIGSNESAYVVAVLFPLFAWTEGIRGRRLAMWAGPPLTVIGLGLTARQLVLGRLGGYHKRYFAQIVDGKHVLRHLEDSEPMAAEIAVAAWDYVLFPSSPSGEVALLTDLPGGLALKLAVAGALALALVLSVWRRDPVSGLAALWLLGLTALYGLAGNWFWRMGFPLLLPLSLLLPRLVAQAVAASHGRRGLALVGAPPLVLLLLGMAVHSAVVHGSLRDNLKGRARASRAVHAVRNVLPDLPSPSVVWVAMPMRFEQAFSGLWWLRHMGDRRGRELRLLAVSDGTGELPKNRMLREEDREGAPWIAPRTGVEWSGQATRKLPVTASGGVPLYALSPRPDEAQRPVFVVQPSRSGMQVLQVPSPSSAARVPGDP